jgi:hypothetical protein
LPEGVRYLSDDDHDSSTSDSESVFEDFGGTGEYVVDRLVQHDYIDGELHLRVRWFAMALMMKRGNLGQLCRGNGQPIPAEAPRVFERVARFCIQKSIRTGLLRYQRGRWRGQNGENVAAGKSEYCRCGMTGVCRMETERYAASTQKLTKCVAKICLSYLHIITLSCGAGLIKILSEISVHKRLSTWAALWQISIGQQLSAVPSGDIRFYCILRRCC